MYTLFYLYQNNKVYSLFLILKLNKREITVIFTICHFCISIWFLLIFYIISKNCSIDWLLFAPTWLPGSVVSLQSTGYMFTVISFSSRV